MSLRWNSLVLTEGVEEVAHLPALVCRVVIKHHDQPLLAALGLDASLEVREIVEKTLLVGAPVLLEVSMADERARDGSINRPSFSPLLRQRDPDLEVLVRPCLRLRLPGVEGRLVEAMGGVRHSELTY
jgi:hypothetical protein